MLALALASSLVLSAAPGQLVIDVKPDGVEVKVDGKKVGTSGQPLTVKLKAGKHIVRLVHKGDAHEEEVTVKAGEKKTWTWEFEGYKKPAAPEGEGGGEE